MMQELRNQLIQRDHLIHSLQAQNADLLAALEGCCSRIGDKWHRLGCEAFSQPFGECDYACVQARAAIASVEVKA